jgi:hypothetical protein
MMTSLAMKGVDQLLIEILRADIGCAAVPRLEGFLEEQIVGGGAFVLDVVLEKPSGLIGGEVEVLHHLYDPVVDGNLLKAHVDTVAVGQAEFIKPWMFSDLAQFQSVLRVDVYQLSYQVLVLRGYLLIDDVESAFDLTVKDGSVVILEW